MKKENSSNLNQLRDSMSRELKTLSDIKNLFDISEENIIKWLNDFRDYFSEYTQREEPLFTSNDINHLLVMNSTEDYEDIESNITSDRWMEYTLNEYKNLEPFLRNLDDLENPEEFAERLHSLQKGQAESILTYAKIYRRATQELLNIVVEEHDDPNYYYRKDHLIYPVIYLFRHTIELYLKSTAQRATAGKIKGHTLENIIDKIETSADSKFPKWVKNQLLYLDSFDKDATAFRYPDEKDFYEYVVDLRQLNYLIQTLCDLFEGPLNQGKIKNHVPKNNSKENKFSTSTENVNKDSIKRLNNIKDTYRISDDELSRQCEITKAELHKITKNKEKNIPKVLLYYIAYKFGINPDWILNGNEPKML